MPNYRSQLTLFFLNLIQQGIKNAMITYLRFIKISVYLNTLVIACSYFEADETKLNKVIGAYH